MSDAAGTEKTKYFPIFLNSKFSQLNGFSLIIDEKLILLQKNRWKFVVFCVLQDKTKIKSLANYFVEFLYDFALGPVDPKKLAFPIFRNTNLSGRPKRPPPSSVPSSICFLRWNFLRRYYRGKRHRCIESRHRRRKFQMRLKFHAHSDSNWQNELPLQKKKNEFSLSRRWTNNSGGKFHKTSSLPISIYSQNN